MTLRVGRLWPNDPESDIGATCLWAAKYADDLETVVSSGEGPSRARMQKVQALRLKQHGRVNQITAGLRWEIRPDKCVWLANYQVERVFLVDTPTLATFRTHKRRKTGAGDLSVIPA